MAATGQGPQLYIPAENDVFNVACKLSLTNKPHYSSFYTFSLDISSKADVQNLLINSWNQKPEPCWNILGVWTHLHFSPGGSDPLPANHQTLHQDLVSSSSTPPTHESSCKKAHRYWCTQLDVYICSFEKRRHPPNAVFWQAELFPLGRVIFFDFQVAITIMGGVKDCHDPGRNPKHPHHWKKKESLKQDFEIICSDKCWPEVLRMLSKNIF